MATLADSLVSSTSRPLTLRMRPDLAARQHRYHGQTFWVVKEPIGLNYFRFHEEEFAILQMLDGHSSLDHIKEEFESEFAPQKITFQDLQQFIGMLHRSGLVISTASGQGRQLKKRRDEKKRRELLGKLSNVFAIRFRGLDPEWMFSRLYPFVKWIFHPVCVFFCMVLALSALLLILVQFDVFRSRLPAFHEFFAVKDRTYWLLLMATLAGVKVVHEFGHGMSCKHFGGECHELGAMLLVFTPCLYCNVSDSWMLPNKYHRAIIGAAGMYVEVVMASIATFIWWFSEPGLLNFLCLQVMFVCSVSTLIFNGNPLLRFDGYYILMDLAEIPNLRQKSTEVLKRFMVQLCLGIEQPENPFLPQGNRFLFGMYTVAAVVYRWIVVLSICWFLNQVLEPIGLKVVGRVIALAGIFGLVVQPLWQLGKFFYTPGRMHKVKKHRLIASVAVVVVAIAAVIFVPLPHSVTCDLELGPRDAASVYVDTAGMIEKAYVRPGERVEAGAPILDLTNVDLELSVAELEGRRALAETRLRSLDQERYRDENAGMQLEQARELLETISEQLKEKQAELSRLHVVAPVAGLVLAAPPRPPRPEVDGQLPTWAGSPLDEKNRGSLLTESDLVCRVGDPKDLEALLVVDQADIELVDEVVIKGERPKVRIQLEAFPGTTLHSEIAQIAKVQLKVTPSSLTPTAGGQLETKTDASGVARPMSTSYQARAPLPADNSLQGLLRMGMRGCGKIQTRPQSLGERLYRYLARTFHFEL